MPPHAPDNPVLASRLATACFPSTTAPLFSCRMRLCANACSASNFLFLVCALVSLACPCLHKERSPNCAFLSPPRQCPAVWRCAASVACTSLALLASPFGAAFISQNQSESKERQAGVRAWEDGDAAKASLFPSWLARRQPAGLCSWEHPIEIDPRSQSARTLQTIAPPLERRWKSGGQRLLLPRVLFLQSIRPQLAPARSAGLPA